MRLADSNEGKKPRGLRQYRLDDGASPHWLDNLKKHLAFLDHTELDPGPLFQRIEEPQDIAEVVVFLASDLSRFLTGESINATGGVLMD